MYDVMYAAGERAASAVQPRWKTITKLVVTLGVGIAIGALARVAVPALAGFVGLVVGEGLLAVVLAGALFGAASGAVSGLVVRVSHNAIDLMGEAAPLDANGAPLTLFSNVMGWKGAVVTGAWTGALAGGLSGAVGVALVGERVLAFVAGHAVNFCVDVVAQLHNTGHYSLATGIENLAISAAIGGAAPSVGAARGPAEVVAPEVESPSRAEPSPAVEHTPAQHAPVEDAPATDRDSSSLEVSPEHAKGHEVDGTIHHGADPEAHLAEVERHGVAPRETVVVGQARYRVGPLFPIGQGRLGALIHVEVGGKTYLRAVYQSKSQGAFRVLPATNRLPQFAPGIDKSVGEHAGSLPSEVDAVLARRLVDDGVRADVDAKAGARLFEGAAPHNDNVLELAAYESSADHMRNHVTHEPILEGAGCARPGRAARVSSPAEVRIADAGHRPDFTKLVRQYRTSTPLAGDVDALVYHSADGSIEYVVLKDAGNHIWFQSASRLGAKITPHGVREVAIDAKALCTPLWEYAEQLPFEHKGEAHAQDRSYVNAWRFVRALPEVQAWYEATGTAMPAETTIGATTGPSRRAAP